MEKARETLNWELEQLPGRAEVFREDQNCATSQARGNHAKTCVKTLKQLSC